jgi:ubiquitin-protein ligase
MAKQAQRKHVASVRDGFFGERAIDSCWLGVAAFCDTLSLGELLSAAPDLGSASRNARLNELWQSHLHALRRHARTLLREACNGSTSIGSCKNGCRRRGAWSLSTVPARYDCVSFVTAEGVKRCPNCHTCLLHTVSRCSHCASEMRAHITPVSAGMISDIISRHQGKVQLKTTATGGDEPQYTVVQLVEAMRRDKEAELEEPGQWCFTRSPFTPTAPSAGAGWRSEAIRALWLRQCTARLLAEFLELKLWPLPGFRVELGDSGVTGVWHCVVPGMQGTFLQNTEFKLDMTFPSEVYPIKPPKLMFIPADGRPMFHMNALPSGTVDMWPANEGEGYMEGTTPRDLLLFCEEFLACANKYSPANADAYHLFLQCIEEPLPYMLRLRDCGNPVLRAPGEKYGVSGLAAEEKIVLCPEFLEAALDARERRGHTKALIMCLEPLLRVERHVIE